ncbi:Hsp70 family protein [Nocardia sp. NBC_00565]|uniref:Hsp70 family protein n=1 Tax=Nocardia sp. NBC_00565 TaxID=2975993 RepID=UPI002E8054C9|nr:Hsp70 family protein [Nocardia sp. NBC_00565]WUC02414.1 Hsp70 family protein [Nocardia sp. NBC_00565]
MTERVALGITVGASNSVAVATPGDGSDYDSGHSGGTVITHPSVLRFAADAAPTFGSSARRTGRHSSDVVLEGFLARVGDPVDILAEDGTAHSAADLVATAVTCLIDEIGPGAARATVACHPAWWSRHTVDVQRAALDRARLREVTLVPEPTATMRWLETAHGPLGDGAVVVYDLGASGLTVSVVRTGDQAAVLGAPLRSTDVAGAEFDLLTMRYVLANAMRGNEFDPFDPVIERELSALRERCRYAKEELSTNTATVVPVRLNPADHHAENIRLVRGELEDLLRGPLLTSIELIRDAVHRAGLDIGDIGRVLLAGGGGAIPLVAELISTEFGLPVVAAPEPQLTSALGAAALAADLLAATVDRTPVAAIAAGIAKTEELPTVPRGAERVARPTGSPMTNGGRDTVVHNPTLPSTSGRSRRKLTGRQRAAIVAGAALVLGVLATGTVALGTGAQSTTNQPAGTDQTTAPGASAVAATTDGNPSGPVTSAAMDSPVGSPSQPKSGAGQPGSPAATTVAVVNSQPTPGQTAAGQPANGQPTQSQPTQSQPTPAQQPSADTPTPQPQPTTQPQVPTAPSLPGVDTLGNAVEDTVGGVVSVLPKIPGGR